jgi:hypothetical protein
MKNMLCAAVMLMVQCLAISAYAFQLDYSARSNISENPFLAYGYNPRSKVITGYLTALRTAPGRTDECKLVFKGRPNRLSVKYLEHKWVSGGENRDGASVFITTEKGTPSLRFSKNFLGGDCDWILPFNIGPRVSESADEVAVTMKAPNVGSWIGVYAISAKRTHFHSQPEDSSMRKAYLVEGDVIFVYEERPEWYFVQYENGKRKTVGWIRKADTVQP